MSKRNLGKIVLMLHAFLIGGICWLPTSLSADIRCATVNIDMIIARYQKHAEEAKILKDQLIKSRLELTILREKRKEVNGSIRELAKKILKLATPPPRDSDIRNEYNTLISRHQSLGKDIEELERENIRTLEKDLSVMARKSQNEIQAVIDQYAREKGYQWVIEKSGRSNTGISPLIYARNAPDITREIISVLNKDAPAEANEAISDKTPDEQAEPEDEQGGEPPVAP